MKLKLIPNMRNKIKKIISIVKDGIEMYLKLVVKCIFTTSQIRKIQHPYGVFEVSGSNDDRPINITRHAISIPEDEGVPPKPEPPHSFAKGNAPTETLKFTNLLVSVIVKPINSISPKKVDQ